MTPTPSTQKKTDLLTLNLPQLQQWLKEHEEAPFRAKQIYNWLYRQLVTDFAAMTNLPQTLRDLLSRRSKHRTDDCHEAKCTQKMTVREKYCGTGRWQAG